jgi:hypothetical protein
MNKKQLKEPILDLGVRKEVFEEQSRQHRDEMNRLEGASWEIELLILKLEELSA